MTTKEKLPRSYREAGVDIEAGNALARRLGPLARPTLRPEVISGIGGFAGLMGLPAGLTEPVLVASTDGVGTKLKVAFLAGEHRTVGIDLVAMAVNDLITVGAEPLLFLDYFATGKLSLEQAEAVVQGIVEGCRQAGCTLLGGETAEMPGMYAAEEYDLAGFAVGVVERRKIIDGSRVQAGDAVIGLPSSGLHSNGYSLARQLLLPRYPDLRAVVPELGRSLADELLTPTIIYVAAARALWKAVEVHALAHITGGGLIDNPPRVVPESLAFRFFVESWPVPPVMQLIAKLGQLPLAELRRTFNMGLGLLAVVPAASREAALEALEPHGGLLVGEIIARQQEAVEFLP